MEALINDFLKMNKISYEYHKYFTDGASSKVVLINNKYLLKQNNVETLKAEITFLNSIHKNTNISSFFQKIVYIDPEYKYVVYEFIEGNIIKNPTNIKDIVEKLLLITSNYSEYKKDKFGYLGEEVSSWSKFLEDEVQNSSENIKAYISDNSMVFDAITILKDYTFTKKLLHGDFGTHNFVEKDGLFVGVIDPMPVIGDSLYDLLFAICSNTKILTHFTLNDILCLTGESTKKVKALFAVVLYSRISRCLKYHPKDINIYMEYWNKLNS